MNKVELLLDCKNTLGEGITYSSVNNNLYWLDINNKSKLFKLNLSSNKSELFELPEIVTATSVKSDDELILASNNGLNLFTISSKKFELANMGFFNLLAKKSASPPVKIIVKFLFSLK